MMSIFDHVKTKQVIDFNLEEKVFKYSPSLKSAATMTSVEMFTKQSQGTGSLPKEKGSAKGQTSTALFFSVSTGICPMIPSCNCI